MFFSGAETMWPEKEREIAAADACFTAEIEREWAVVRAYVWQAITVLGGLAVIVGAVLVLDRAKGVLLVMVPLLTVIAFRQFMNACRVLRRVYLFHVLLLGNATRKRLLRYSFFLIRGKIWIDQTIHDWW